MNSSNKEYAWLLISKTQRRNWPTFETSVVTSKAAIRGHFKTGHMNWPET
jgi:hypothetical protein